MAKEIKKEEVKSEEAVTRKLNSWEVPPVINEAK
jgi:hypothetical protein